MMNMQILQIKMNALIVQGSVVMEHVGIELEDLNVFVVQVLNREQTAPVKV